MHKPRLLLIEDDPSYARLIGVTLTLEGFEVRSVRTAENGLDVAAEIHPDAVILDLDLRGSGGATALEELRERPDMPVLVVTKARTPDAIRSGLDHGADDYITKPFSPQEMAARVRAVLRRRHRPRLRRYRVGPSIVDLDARTVESANPSLGPRRGRTIGRGGWRLLEALLGNEGRIMYSDELLEAAFGPDFRGDSAYLQEQIRRLRRGLGIPAWTEGPIRTVHGVGYAFDVADEIPVARARRPHAAAGADWQGRAQRPRKPTTSNGRAGRPG